MFASSIVLATCGVVTGYWGAKKYGNRRKYRLVDVLGHSAPVYPVQRAEQSLLKIRIQKKLGYFFWNNTRAQQMRDITGEVQEISVEEKYVNRFFAISSVNLGIIVMSVMKPALIWLTLPGIVYSSIPVYILTYKSFKERRVSSYLIDALLITGMILGGFWVTATLGLWVILAGRKLLINSENNSKYNLQNLLGAQPRSVWILVNDSEVEIPFEELQTSAIIVVRAGQTIPVDGVVTDGLASVDQHTLTGESKPVEKSMGDPVLASTIVLAGRICIETQKTGQETVAMQIGETLQKTADFKSLIESRGEAVADQLVLPSIGISLLFWPIFGFSSALAALTNTFGFKMRVFAPASMLSFLNIASHQGILIKDGRSLDLLNEVDTVVFDKTGTLTLEQPTVDKIHTWSNVFEEDILMYAAAAESGQTHPIARAILAAAHERQLCWPKLEHSRYEVGYGIQVNLPDRVVRVGSVRFMVMENINIPPQISHAQEFCHEQGHSLVMIAFDDQVVGAIELHTTLRPEVEHVIAYLRQRKMEIYIISGDHEEPTQKMAQALGIDHYFANTLPEDKAELITQLQEQGNSVCFVGDGINDAIALKKANVSISLRGATTAATDTAQIIFMDGTLNQLEPLFDLVQDFEINMRNNLLISTIPTAICLGGIIFLHWGIFSATLLTGGILFMGIGNTLLPLLKLQRDKN